MLGLLKLSLEPNAAERLHKVGLHELRRPALAVVVVVGPGAVTGERRRRLAQRAGGEVGDVEHAARSQHAEHLRADGLRRRRRHLVEQDVGADEVDRAVVHRQVFGQRLRKGHVQLEVDRALVGVAQHGCRDVHPRDLRVRERLLQRHRQLADAAADVHDAFDAAVRGSRDALGQGDVELVPVVLPHVEAVGAVVVERPGERVADIAAGLDVHLVPAIVGDRQAGVQLQATGTSGVGLVQRLKVVVLVPLELVRQACPHLALVGDPHPHARGDQRVGVKQAAQVRDVHRLAGLDAVSASSASARWPTAGSISWNNPLAKAADKVLLALHVQAAQAGCPPLCATIQIHHRPCSSTVVRGCKPYRQSPDDPTTRARPRGAGAVRGARLGACGPLARSAAASPPAGARARAE